MKVLPRLAQRLRKWIRPDEACLLAWAAAAITLEIAGRAYPHELTDLGGLAVLALLGYWTIRLHRQVHLRAVSWLRERGMRVVRWLQSFAIDLGVDLREKPPLEGSVPPLLRAALYGLLAVTIVLLRFHDAFPSDVRGVVAAVCYVGWLVAFAALWATLLGGTLMLLFVPFAVIHDAAVSGYTGQLRRPMAKEIVRMALFLAVLVVLGFALPAWVPLVLLALLVVVPIGILALPQIPRLTLLWRRKPEPGGSGAASRIYSLDYRWVAGGQVVILALFVASVMIVASGERLFPDAATAGLSMPFTSGVGITFGWAACAGVGAFVYLVLKGVMLGWKLNPNAPCPPALFVHGVVEESLERWVRGSFPGWTVRFPPDAPDSTDVEIRITEDGFDLDRPERWPLAVSAGDLEDPSIQRRIVMRDRIQKRRLLLRGLEKLFKRAARRNFKQGEGFWIGIQHWYVMGLSRDTDEQELDFEEGTLLTDIIGPPYHRVFSLPVRHHFAEMMGALQIDLIFVEDGVGYRRLKRVLRTLFDVYDATDGRERAEDHHFAGIPDVSVMIHDVAMDRPFSSDTYPEPDYEDVGRARILHVFKDRDKDHELDLPPVDLEFLPVPSGAA